MQVFIPQRYRDSSENLYRIGAGLHANTSGLLAYLGRYAKAEWTNA